MQQATKCGHRSAFDPPADRLVPPPIAAIYVFCHDAHMRQILIMSVLLLGACSEQIEESYPTWADAERAGAIARGWLPYFVPMSALSIRDSHDLDTGQQTLQFSVPLTDVSVMVSEFAHISTGDESAAYQLSKELGFTDRPDAFVVCSNVRNGVLFVNLETGQAAYDTTHQVD